MKGIYVSLVVSTESSSYSLTYQQKIDSYILIMDSTKEYYIGLFHQSQKVKHQDYIWQT